MTAAREIHPRKCLNANSLTAQPAVVTLDYALRVGPADRGRIRVHGVQQELRQVPRIIVGHDDSRVDIAATDSVSQFVDREVVTRETKTFAFS